MTIATIEEKDVPFGDLPPVMPWAHQSFYPETACPRFEMTGGGKFNLPPGAWTDDTSMALCLGHSLIHSPDLDAADLLNRFWNWATKIELCSQDKAFGFGQNTLRTLMSLQNWSKLTADSTGNILMAMVPSCDSLLLRSFIIQILKNTTRRTPASFTTHASKGADCCEF